MNQPVYLGIDIGTSGIRGCCIDSNKNEIASHHIPFAATALIDGCSEQDAMAWQQQCHQLLTTLAEKLKPSGYAVRAICIDGTSSTLLACTEDGTPLSPALMYNDQQAVSQAAEIAGIAPADSAVHGASSSLAKAMLLLERFPDTRHLCHQADWLGGWLTGDYTSSDNNNCLKMGYDSTRDCWPAWLQDCLADTAVLPRVVEPGKVSGKILPQHISRFGLAEDCVLVAGTTDSNAAVLASGAGKPGDAVTSLGSTLVVKVFTDKPVFDPGYGIYSHRLNGNWLAGGASNTGGAVLLQHFTTAQLAQMTAELQPQNPTGLDYYPLPATGERFPVCDPQKASKITPRPHDDTVFFQGLLEGMAQIEADAYHRLEQLGALRPGRIFTAGGGSTNAAWSKIREATIGIPVLKAEHTQASYGSALLALQACAD